MNTTIIYTLQLINQAKLKLPAILEEVIKDLSFHTGSHENEQLKIITPSITLDNSFPTYNAIQVPETHLIAAEGPRCLPHEFHGDVSRLFENSIFNNKNPVSAILAIGHAGFPEGNFFPHDFYDYFCTGEQVFHHNHDDPLYKVNAKLVCGYEESNPNELQVFRLGLTEMSVTVSRNHEQKNIQIYNIPIFQNYSVLLCPDQRLPNLAKQVESIPELFWVCPVGIAQFYKIYQLSLKQPLLIHSRTGTGRTGHVILTFMLVSHFDQVFQGTADTIADNIKGLLKILRKSHPTFVHTEAQLKIAIINAIQLKEHEILQISC